VSAAEKIEHLLGITLDRARDIMPGGRALSAPAECAHTQVWRIVFMIGVKALLGGKIGHEAACERNRDAVLEELTRQLGEKEAAASGA
jgi:hypothetical protein